MGQSKSKPAGPPADPTSTTSHKPVCRITRDHKVSLAFVSEDSNGYPVMFGHDTTKPSMVRLTVDPGTGKSTCSAVDTFVSRLIEAANLDDPPQYRSLLASLTAPKFVKPVDNGAKFASSAKSMGAGIVKSSASDFVKRTASALASGGSVAGAASAAGGDAVSKLTAGVSETIKAESDAAGDQKTVDQKTVATEVIKMNKLSDVRDPVTPHYEQLIGMMAHMSEKTNSDNTWSVSYRNKAKVDGKTKRYVATARRDIEFFIIIRMTSLEEYLRVTQVVRALMENRVDMPGGVVINHSTTSMYENSNPLSTISSTNVPWTNVVTQEIRRAVANSALTDNMDRAKTINSYMPQTDKIDADEWEKDIDRMKTPVEKSGDASNASAPKTNSTRSRLAKGALVAAGAAIAASQTDAGKEMIAGAKGFITNLFGDGKKKGAKHNVDCGDLIDEISAIRTLALKALKAHDPTEGLNAIVAITDGMIDKPPPRRKKGRIKNRRPSKTVALLTDSGISDKSDGSENSESDGSDPISSESDAMVDTSDDDSLDGV
jgi:hypothetical protein